MGSDWGTHGEESYPEAAWLQLEVFHSPFNVQSSSGNFNFDFFFQLEVFDFICKTHLLGILNLIFSSVGSQEGIPAHGQFPLNIASDQVSIFR